MQCQKCNNPLEIDSKFCTYCETPIPEEILTNVEEKVTTSKVKTYTFKIIAFIIAIYIFGLSRMIVMATTGSDKVAVGGILLFYGVYALLSGLFLKDKSAIKRGSWFLGIYIVGSIALSLYF